jgi:hypothetical protein
MKDRMLLTDCGQLTRIARNGFGLLLCLIAVVGIASAQVRNGTITGTVTDQNGAVIPKANVTVTNEDTGISEKTVSGAAGDYSVPYLPQGRYSVSVDASGFETFRATGIAIQTDATVRIDANLKVGAATVVIQVQASAAQLQTENATVTEGVGEQVIDSVPNITNNPLYYATLGAGVVPAPGMYDTKDLGVGYQARQEYSAIRINGGMLGTDDVTLDGVPMQGSAWQELTVVPNRDSLQEVTVSTNSLSADVGGGQGIIQLVTKSGTNKFHGDLYYNLRNEMFNANGLSNDMQNIPRGKYRVNEAGGSVGGPVMFPKLFSLKDRAFFFVSFDRLSHTQTASGYYTVPTALERTGDYSQTKVADNNGNAIGVNIYNPWSATPVAGTGGQGFLRQQYPHNKIQSMGYGPFDELDPAGVKLLNAYPMPNYPSSSNPIGTDQFGNNNYYFSGTAPTLRDDLNARLDFHLGKNSLYASGGVQDGSSQGVNSWGNSSPWYNLVEGDDIADFNPYAAVGDIITLSPTLLVDVHFGLQRVNTHFGVPPGGSFTASDYTSYGIPTDVQSYIASWGAAPSTWTIGQGEYGGNWQGSPLNNDTWLRKSEHQTNPSFSGSVTKILSKWTSKNGAEYRVHLGNWADVKFGTPQATANDCNCEIYGSLSGAGNGNLISNYVNSLPNGATTGQNPYWGTGKAQMEIGTGSWNLASGTTTPITLAAKYFALYSQNDWKVTKDLTVNLGLRYEIQPGPTERHNRMDDIDLTVPGPYSQGATVPNASPQMDMGAIAFSGLGIYPRNMWNSELTDISPRLGMAYRLTDSMTIRAGYGRMYEPSNTGFNANVTVYGGAPFSGGTGTVGGGNNPYTTASNGLPVAPFENAAATTLFPALGAVQAPDLYGNGNEQSNVDLFLRSGYHNAVMDQWNFFFERRMKGWLASAGYVGSRGTHLPWRGFPLNGQFNSSLGQIQDWRSTWLANNGQFDPAAVQIPNPMPALCAASNGPPCTSSNSAAGSIGAQTISVGQSQQAYLDLLGQTVLASAGSSRYNAMELKLQHSYSNGLTAQFLYTFSRTTGISGGSGGSTYAESQQGDTNASGGTDWRSLMNGNGKVNSSILGYDTPQRFVGVVTYELPFGKGKRFNPENPAVREIVGGWHLSTVVTLQSGMPWGPGCGSQNGGCIPTGQPLQVAKQYQHWYNGHAQATLPDGRIITPNQYTYLKWNPDAFTAPLVQFPNGNYSTDYYWNGTTPTYMNSLRLPYFRNTNINITREFAVTERLKVQFVADGTNAFNNQNFLPDSTTQSGRFNQFGSPQVNGSNIGMNSSVEAGALTANMYDPRQITFTLRVTF